jgi:hypothetical protein
VPGKVEPAFNADEHGGITCWRALNRANAGARERDISNPPLFRHMTGDGFGERTPAGVASANEDDSHRYNGQLFPISPGTA